MQAIRIEHSDGNGLWRSNNKSVYELNCMNSIIERHRKFPNPTWEGDVKGFIEGVHYCAFKSVEQLQQWIFPDEIREILDNGFKVYLLDLSEGLEGNYQIAYQKQHITQQKDISELFI